MAEESVQERFTGRSGIDLYKQTAAFVRQLEGQFARHRQRALDGASVLDFGCGYGRIIRMMYYYADPSHIWGVDAEQTPLDICNKDRVKANLAKIENIPSNLPLKEKSIDLAYAYSVFTHLPGHVADACLQAIKKTMRPNALFIATIWPVEVWSVIDTMRKTEFVKTMPGIHERTGLAHVPHDVHKDYGLTTTSPKFFEERGWNVLGYESSIFDPNQISIVLELE
jgi:SAM-dependent methyltransferase